MNTKSCWSTTARPTNARGDRARAERAHVRFHRRSIRRTAGLAGAATPASRARAASASSSSTTTCCRCRTSSRSICARTHRHPQAIVRGGAINVESFDDLPPPVWTSKNYSGNSFWTTNVSVPLRDDPRDRRLQRNVFRIRLGRHRRRFALARQGRQGASSTEGARLSLQAAAAQRQRRKDDPAGARASAHGGATRAECIRIGARISRPETIRRSACCHKWMRGIDAAGRYRARCSAISARTARSASASCAPRAGWPPRRTSKNSKRALIPSVVSDAFSLAHRPHRRSDAFDAGDRDRARILPRCAHHDGDEPVQPRRDGAQPRRRRTGRSAARYEAARVRRARFAGYDLAIALAPRAADLQLVGATRAAVASDTPTCADSSRA